VGSTNAASRNNKRERFVACIFQVSKHTLEDHASVLTKEARNILCQHPFGLCFPYDSTHLRPEETVIFLALPLPGTTEWLARKASGEKPRSSVLGSIEFSDVSDDRDSRPVFCEDSLTEWFDFTEHSSTSSVPSNSESEPADA